VKAILVLSVLTMLVVVGCGGKAPAPQPQALNVAPPPAPQPAPAAAPVTPVTYTPAPVEEPVAAPAAGAASGKKYVVQRGDTLWGIATRTYGDGKQYKKIVAANPSIKGERVNAGQTIVLP
jgi:nucleoid-associated protein YgaU